MPAVQEVSLIRSGNRLVVDPTTEAISSLLVNRLTFESKKFLYGYERKAHDGARVLVENWQCYQLDHAGRIATSFGYYKRLSDVLKSSGYAVKLIDEQEAHRRDVMEPQWDRLYAGDSPYQLRKTQDEFLIKFFSNPCGRFDAATGYGKTFLIGLVATLIPKAKIHVVSKRASVLRDRIWPELAQMLPSVGIVGGGKRITDRRVMCYSVDSLQHSDGDADVLIGDECHEMAADEAAYMLGRYQRSNNYGFSASHDMRLDGKDMRVEGIFGPLVYRIGYQKAEELGLVVPIQVVWTKVRADRNPCEGIDDGVSRKRYGVWRNEARNAIIAEDARSYGDDVQVLITVETIDHLMHLKKLLPEYTVVYAEDGLDARDRAYYVRNGMINEDEPPMTLDRRKKLTSLFERGKLKKAICTTVWNVGVDFKQLAVLIRADAGGSPINDVQIPGRVSRTYRDPETGTAKQFAVVRDYTDKFDRGFAAKATKRMKSYAAQGWQQIMPEPEELPKEQWHLS